MSELTHEDVQRILAIIDSIGDRTVSFEYGDIKLHMTRSGETASPGSDAVASMASMAPMASAASVASAAPGPGHPAPGTPAGQGGIDAGPAAARAEIPEGMVAVTAPTSGTFYRSASPASPPFVEVGDRVEANDTVAVFDVMKLFMSLRAGVKGTVAAILVENQSVAEQGQPLVLIRPD